MMYHNRIFI